MNRRWLVFSWFAMLLACAPGCLFVRAHTQVVREKEPKRTVNFESEQAKTLFEAGVHQTQALKECTDTEAIAIPFLYLGVRTKTLSDNAIYNDQAGICDANGDNFITVEEAAAYRAQVDEKVALAQKANAAKPGSDDSKSDGPVSVGKYQSDQQPPALIHISSRSSASR